jgi:hypothetical protein
MNFDASTLRGLGRDRARRYGWHRRLSIVVVVAATAFVALGGGAAGAVGRPSDAPPATWDKQVAPIAARVAKLRGLAFEHPVPTHYLSDAAFRKRVRVDSSKLSRSDRRRVADLEGTLRAFGLIDAKTDLVKSVDTVQQAGVLAFYDPQKKEIVIRGVGPLDVDRKATLAHELTHVLQDQHFDLERLRHAASSSKTGSSGALTALIEGDAERIKAAYIRGLSRSDQDAYDAAQAKTADSAGAELDQAPELFKIEFEAPYVFGPNVLDVLAAHGGNRAVDAAFRQPPPTDQIYLDPVLALKPARTVSVSTPQIPHGAHRIGSPDDIGAFDLYTLLASRIDRHTALDAADTWAGDRYVTYRGGKGVCARATIATRSAAGARTLDNALRAWAAAMPAATVTSDAGHRRSTVTSCDSGSIAAPGTPQLEGALRLLAVRNAILASIVHGGAPAAVGECVSRRIVGEPVMANLIDTDAAPSAAVQQQLQNATVDLVNQCRGENGF